MATPKTGRPRGRPQYDFLHDPERFAIALGRAFMSLGASENDSFRRVAALIQGKEVGRQTKGSTRKRGRGAVPAGTWVTYATKVIPEGSAGSLAGKGSTLRKNATKTQLDPKAAAWLLVWTNAFHLALCASEDLEFCASLIMELGNRVKNGTLAEDQLLPTLAARLPDITPNV